MHVITGRGVNLVYAQAIQLVRSKGVLQPSRAGDVLTVPEPVVLETERPQERVLLDPKRDANPFLHFFESLHMLAGRRDYTFLDRFVRDFSSRFAEEDGNGWGAYGYRWRKHFDYHRLHIGPLDQLEQVIHKLKKDPFDRRVVIAMWDPSSDLNMEARDIPCNTHIYPRIVPNNRSFVENTLDGYQHLALDLMVCCRSNDVVWGACGANAVHFAFLQEYLAGRIGVQVGTLRQMTTNLHGYTATLAKVGDPSGWDPYDDVPNPVESFPSVGCVPIGTDWERWDEDLLTFLTMVESREFDPKVDKFHNDWFRDVATPMWYAHAYWRLGNPSSSYLTIAQQIQASDWCLAALQWLERRTK